MSFTRAEIEAEIRRRAAGGETTGAPTATVSNPAGPSAAEFTEQARSMDAPGASGLELTRNALRGATMGLSDHIGAGVAGLAGSFETGEHPFDAYQDIIGTLRDQEAEAEALDPERMALAEGAGFATTAVGSALPSASRAALSLATRLRR